MIARTALALVGLASITAGNDFVRFEAKTLDPEIGNVACYAVVPADVDGDGKLDVVAVSENRVQWYQNPSWTKRIMIEDQTQTDNVCIAPHDVDGDGKVDFALGAGWLSRNAAPEDKGSLQWLARGETLDEKWRVYRIGNIPWTHRMRFADVLGVGRPQLVVSPLNKTEGDGVALTAFRIPDDPRRDRWMPTVLDHSLNRMHNHWHFDLDDDGAIDTLTASVEGIYWLRRSGSGFDKVRIATGMPGESPQQSGAGEIKVGRLAGGEPFLVTVEPMHGTSVAVYTRPEEGGPGALWRRQVIEETLRQGHAIWPADLDGDGEDEIVVGHRAAGTGPIKGPGLYVFDNRGGGWNKHVLDDGGVAVEDAFAADLTGDGKPDIVAGGRATKNLKLYVNLGRD